MKKYIHFMPPAYVFVYLIVIFFLSACGTSGQAVACGKEEAAGRITAICPEARQYLPPFPSFSDREAFYNDSLQYRRGFELRASERGKQAVADAQSDLPFYLKRFGEAMGINLSEKTTPAIAEYIRVTYKFARSGISTAKESLPRQRPYSYFGEHSAIPEEEGAYGEFTSYPSGHALRGWVIAMALVAIDKSHNNEIIKVGLEIGESRIIAGFHYASDVEYARICASVGFAKIVSDPEYLKLMDRAREELLDAADFHSQSSSIDY